MRNYTGVPMLTNHQPNVLLVEDNVVALHLIETISAQAGLQSTSALNGEHALALVKSNAYDLIITDIGLPGISGYELSQAIRLWEKVSLKKPIPIIGLTALPPFETRKECLNSGMNTMLCKPINLQIIQELVQEFIVYSA